MSKITKKLSSIALLTMLGASIGASGLQLNSNILGHNTVVKAEELDKTEETIESTEVTQSNQKVVNESEVTEVKENPWNYSEELTKEGFQALPEIQGEMLNTWKTPSSDSAFYTESRMYFENDRTVREPKIGDIVVIEQSSNYKLYGTHRKFDEPNLWVNYDNLKYHAELDKHIVDYYDDTELELLDTYTLNNQEYKFETNNEGKAITNADNATKLDKISNLPISLENTHFIFKYKVTKVDEHKPRNTMHINIDFLQESYPDSPYFNDYGYYVRSALYYTKVNYVDFKTKEKIAESDFILNDTDGDKTFYPKKIDGYLPNEDSKTVSVNSTGDNEITFFYNPDLKKKANITVRYVDKDGNDLLNQEIHRDLLVDKYYEFEAKYIDGYELLSNEKQGLWLRLGGGEIVFTYSKIEPITETGKVIVNYLDEDGNKITDSKEFTDNVDSDFTVNAIDLEGYELVSKGEVTGKVTKEDTIINFVYEKIEKPVEPEVPVEPTEPTTPEKPIEPEAPVEPTKPQEPQTPVEPTEPQTPEVSVEPQGNEKTEDTLYQTNADTNKGLITILITLAVTAVSSLLFIGFKKKNQ
ncbi:TPA: MucBP domain-containing protein [Enterococcus faecium]|uniref:MucBP domain-containing protein n=1 Tax=Enterococcus faecium TaxID=1352 RepID=UPI00376BF5DE